MKIINRLLILLVILLTVFSCSFSGKGLLNGKMVKVRGGEVTIGGGSDIPIYPAKLKSFKICKYEVTNSEFAEVYNIGLKTERIHILDKAVYQSPVNGYILQFALIDTAVKGCRIRCSGTELTVEQGFEQHPVCGVSWYGAAVFCNILSSMEGKSEVYDCIDWNVIKGKKGYRLPTFEEWEYAARGGDKSEGFEYAGSDDPYEAGWFLDNSGEGPNAVGVKKPNELGIYDMSGNLNEFTTEIWSPLRNKNFKPDHSGFGTEGGLLTSNRIWRGGSWNRNPVPVYFFRQSIDQPNYCLGFPDIGFRVVID